MGNLLYLNVIGKHPVWINTKNPEFKPIVINKAALPAYALKISEEDFNKYAALAILTDTYTGFKHYLRAQQNTFNYLKAKSIRAIPPDFTVFKDEYPHDDHIDAIRYAYASFANRPNSNDTTQTTWPIKLYPKP